MAIMFRWRGLSTRRSCWPWLAFRSVIGGLPADGHGRGWLRACGQGEEKLHSQGSRQKSGATGGVDAETVAFGECPAGAEVAFDQRRVLQEAVGDQAQFAARRQVLGGALQQALGGLVVGVHALVEGRIADDRGEFARRAVDAVGGDHFAVQAVGGEGQSAALDSEGVDVEQAQATGGVATLESRPEYAGTAAEVQQMAAGQGLQLPQQQRAAAIQAAMAEHPGRLTTCSSPSASGRL